MSSAILLANLGLLLGGFALTNIDKVIMIKKRFNENDDGDEMVNTSQVQHLADLADSWLGGGRAGNIDVITKVLC